MFIELICVRCWARFFARKASHVFPQTLRASVFPPFSERSTNWSQVTLVGRGEAWI